MDIKPNNLALSRQKCYWFDDDGRRHKAKPLSPKFRQDGRQGEHNHIRSPLKLSLLPGDGYQAELSCPFTAKVLLIRRWWLMVYGQTFVSKFSPRWKARRTQIMHENLWNSITLSNRMIQWRTILHFHDKSVIDSKMMVEDIRSNLCVQSFAKMEGRANTIT